MIRFLILTVGCLITLPTIGQSTFFKRYDLIKGSTAGFQSVFRTPNGYIASSIVSDTSGNEYLGYLGISESGNIRFNKLDTFLSSSPKFGKSIKLHDGNFISLFTGQWFDSSSYLNTISYIVKFNENGDTLWSEKLDSFPDRLFANKIIEGLGGKLFLLLTYQTANNTDPLIVKLNSSGIELNRASFYNTSTYESGKVITLGSDGNLYVSGIGRKFITNKNSLWIAKLDTSDLSTIYAKDQLLNCGELNDLIQLPNGNLFVLGDTSRYFHKLSLSPRGSQLAGYWFDTSGTLLHYRLYGDSTLIYAYKKTFALDNGNILLISDDYKYDSLQIVMYEIDSVGDIIRENRFGYPHGVWGSRINEVTRTDHGGFAFAGTLGSDFEGGEAWILILDSNRCMDPTCRTLIFDKRLISVPENQDIRSEITLYPNPVNNLFHLKGLDPNDMMQIIVYGLDGSMLMERKDVFSSSPIDVAGLPNGMYILEARSDKGQHFIKFVKE